MDVRVGGGRVIPIVGLSVASSQGRVLDDVVNTVSVFSVKSDRVPSLEGHHKDVVVSPGSVDDISSDRNDVADLDERGSSARFVPLTVGAVVFDACHVRVGEEDPLDDGNAGTLLRNDVVGALGPEVVVALGAQEGGEHRALGKDGDPGGLVVKEDGVVEAVTFLIPLEGLLTRRFQGGSRDAVDPSPAVEGGHSRGGTNGVDPPCHH